MLCIDWMFYGSVQYALQSLPRLHHLLSSLKKVHFVVNSLKLYFAQTVTNVSKKDQIIFFVFEIY